MHPTLRRTVVASLSLLPLIAFAHPGHEEPTVSWGVRHPFTGVDHVIALLAVGLWAAQLGGRARWSLPSLFVAALVGGAGVAATGFGVPAVEGMILGSVLTLGALLATAWKAPAILSALIVVLAGFAHGAAHGAQLPAHGPAVAWIAGVTLSSVVMLGLGVGLGAGAQRISRNEWIRIAGGLIAGAGMVWAAS